MAEETLQPVSQYDFNPGRRKKAILTVDGGGMRGAISIAMLAELEDQTGRPVQDLFDMVGGTSTGAVIAAGIGLGLTATEMLKTIYLDQLPKAFGGPRGIGFWLRYLATGLRYLYPLEPFLAGLGPLAKDKKVRDLDRAIVLLTTKDMRTGNTYYIVNAGPGADMFGGWPVSGAVAASGAAPVYFPPVGGNLVDGGVGVYGNPCLATLTEAMEYIGAAQGFVDNGVVCVSLGTGYAPTVTAEGEAGRYSIVEWLPYVIGAGMGEAALQQSFSARAIYRNRVDFRRYNPALSRRSIAEVLGVPVPPAVDPATLGLDSNEPDALTMMVALGRAYARAIDWRIPDQMPWNTAGGHDRPAIMPMDWSRTNFR